MPDQVDRAKHWLRRKAEKLHLRSRPSSGLTRPLSPAPNSTVSDTNVPGVPTDSGFAGTADRLSVDGGSVPAMPDEDLQTTVISSANPDRLIASGDRRTISAPMPGQVLTATAAKPTAEESATAILTVTLELVGKVLKIVHPVIGAAADLMLEILTVYKDVRSTSKQRNTFLAKVTDLSQDVCRMVLRMQSTNSLSLIGRLKPDIDTYTKLLKKASEFIKVYDTQWRLLQIAIPKEFAAKFTSLADELDSFGSRFRSNRLVDLAIKQENDGKILSEVHAIILQEYLVAWLKPFPDMDEKHLEIARHHKPETGNWILEGDTFITWLNQPGSLWIRGESGSGKSVLSSAVINRLLADKQGFIELGDSIPRAVVFFYFDFKDKGGYPVENSLRHMVLQLSKQSPQSHQILHRLHRSKGGTKPSYGDLLKVFKELLLKLGCTYVVLDALDECRESRESDGQLLTLISTLQNWTQTPLHLLITSQPWSIFIENLENVPFIELSPHETQKDIKLFVSSELHTNRKLQTWATDTAAADSITEQVLQKSSGMFRLAACLVDELSRHQRKAPKTLENILAELPTELYDIYSRWLDEIHSDDFVYVKAILCWLIYHKSGGNNAALPLESLADAIAFDFSDSNQYVYNLALRQQKEEDILRGLEGLVTRDHSGSSNPGVVLTHASVQDYLLSEQFKNQFDCDLSADHSHTFMAQTCIGYLLHFSDYPLSKDTIQDFPLAKYAAENWCIHLVQAHDRNSLFLQAMKLLEEGSTQYEAFLSQYTTSRPATPLHLCCWEGYLEGVQALVTERNIEIQEKGLTPLDIASLQGNKGIVQLLLDKGAKINTSLEEYGTMLQLAAAGLTTREMLLLILEKVADVNTQGGAYGTALQEASRRGDVGVVKRLIERGANMNARGNGYGTALEVAAFSGQLKMVELLIGREVSMDSNGGERVKLSASVNIQDQRTGYMALQAAALGGWLDIVQSLLEGGAGVNAEDVMGPTPLQAALYGGHVHIAELFLDKEADVNSRGGEYPSALQAALYGGHIDITWRLLDNGADVNAQCGEYPTALQSAIYGGHLEIARFLLEHRANAMSMEKGHEQQLSPGTHLQR
ncbi:Ectomycorrhiza-induced ankyrin-domain/NACHT-domain containing protein [Mycena venus]|uniref:Ectomycorrhiza-induced ankyrin-domain/NACHT-domain containing protein n=1 Tax=Mycena venus TaxID=2733690 RepID=A0A8H7CNX0_9AGAR|nr:Ectomycorrhiza-induced ankyrin-domain/NACHT-domain containing protein [Mycena venus]